ncbi:MAG TPA: XRE family transcriptional regulator [Chloroflexi bacterium]|nr:XRE family transcriptional regulator [Chloroflexota bacterium]
MSVQIIKREGEPEWAVVPYRDYLRLIEKAEMLQDIQDYDAAMEAVAQGEELIPAEVVYAILEGDNPIRVWREHRGLTQHQLAQAAGISTPYLSQLEAGKRRGSTAVLRAIAQALAVTLEDILPQ